MRRGTRVVRLDLAAAIEAAGGKAVLDPRKAVDAYSLGLAREILSESVRLFVALELRAAAGPTVREHVKKLRRLERETRRLFEELQPPVGDNPGGRLWPTAGGLDFDGTLKLCPALWQMHEKAKLTADDLEKRTRRGAPTKAERRRFLRALRAYWVAIGGDPGLSVYEGIDAVRLSPYLGFVVAIFRQLGRTDKAEALLKALRALPEEGDTGPARSPEALMEELRRLD